MTFPTLALSFVMKFAKTETLRFGKYNAHFTRRLPINLLKASPLPIGQTPGIYRVQSNDKRKMQFIRRY